MHGKEGKKGICTYISINCIELPRYYKINVSRDPYSKLQWMIGPIQDEENYVTLVYRDQQRAVTKYLDK